jgi:hypothetical protein
MNTMTLPRIGAEFPGQGGIYAGVMRGENGCPDYALIVPTDSASMFKDVVWGEYGKRIEGADSNRDGLLNTQAMAEGGSELARNILALQIDGHYDFYLPARHELRLCYLQAPELFETDDWYWTSTQYSPISAWGQYFGGGGQYGDVKTSKLRARAVRRLLI